MAQHQRAPPGPTDSDDGLSTLCSFHISLWWCLSVAGPSKLDASVGACAIARRLLAANMDV